MNETPVVGKPIFTLPEVDLSIITDTAMANAPVLIGAAVSVILIKKAIPVVPKLFAKLIKF